MPLCLAVHAPQHWVIKTLTLWLGLSQQLGLLRVVSGISSGRWAFAEIEGCPLAAKLVMGCLGMTPPPKKKAHWRNEILIDGSLLQMEHVLQEGPNPHQPLGFGEAVGKRPELSTNSGAGPPCLCVELALLGRADRTQDDFLLFWMSLWWLFVIVATSVVIWAERQLENCVIHVTFLPLLWLHAGQDFPLLFPWYYKPLFRSILNTTAGPLTLFQLWDTLLVHPEQYWFCHCWQPHVPGPDPSRQAWISSMTPLSRRGHWDTRTRAAPGAQRQASRGRRLSPCSAPSPSLCFKLHRKWENSIQFSTLSHLLANEWHHLTLFWKERFKVVLKTEGKIQMFEC